MITAVLCVRILGTVYLVVYAKQRLPLYVNVRDDSSCQE